MILSELIQIRYLALQELRRRQNTIEPPTSSDSKFSLEFDALERTIDRINNGESLDSVDRYFVRHSEFVYEPLWKREAQESSSPKESELLTA